MNCLGDIIQQLDVKIFCSEKYYNLNDFLRCLNSLDDETIKAEDYILTPYYIFKGKRMELYEYELSIVVDKKQCFEEYLLALTGKKNISDISDNIIKKRKICYIECEKNTQTIKVASLMKYINFILFNSGIQCQIRKYFEHFSTDNIFFEIF